ncbi:MAG: hypothetical protein AAF329_04955 [Cyanobacteria bacterium P01_A01_bin.17]
MATTAQKTTQKTTRGRARAKAAAKPGSKHRIHFADGNKGGVGKSFLCRTLYQWFKDKAVPVIGIEADVNSPDFVGIYGDVKPSQFSEDERLGARANSIVNTVVEAGCDGLVNLPATVYEAFRIWLKDYDIVNLAEEKDIELVKWFVVTGEFDSLKSLEISLETFDRRIPHVVVKNLKYADWDFFEQATAVQKLIKDTKTPVIELPKLPVRVASTLLQERLTFEQAIGHTGKGFGIVEQAAVRRYLKEAYGAFESTGLLPV